MKKLFVVFIAATFCLGIISCKKNCICKGEYTTKFEQMGVVIEEQTITVPPTSIGQFSKSDCEAYHWFPNDVVDHFDYTIDVTCKSE
jgi:hypothetical protein